MSALQRSVLIVTLGFLLLLLRSVVWRAVALGPFTPQLVPLMQKKPASPTQPTRPGVRC